VSREEIRTLAVDLARKGVSTMIVPLDHEALSECIVPCSKMSGVDAELLIIHAARIEVCAKRAIESVVEYLGQSGVDPKQADKAIRMAVMRLNSDPTLESTTLIDPETGKETPR